MEQKRRKRQKKQTLNKLNLALIAGIVLLFFLCLSVGRFSKPAKKPASAQDTAAQTQTLSTEPEVPIRVASARIASTGDILTHMGVIRSGLQEDKSYYYDPIFQQLAPYTRDADYAVANLETTLGGGSFPYQGNPSFNCPDQIADALKNAGFDMLLTANNHSYDTQMSGMNRTILKVREAGMEVLGTRLSEEENRYSIVEINGIRIGMLCYTYSAGIDSQGRPSLNWNANVEKPEQINFFMENNPDALYAALGQQLEEMKAQGVDATIAYIHWGQEYQLEANASQKAMAQQLCNMGIDVIIGGHPHVVQPVELLTSTVDPEHKTVCLYSMGNAVSNQRQGKLKSITTAHTEDGVLFSVEFAKYSDGTVVLEDADLLPCWVYCTDKNGNLITDPNLTPDRYIILPLDPETRDVWQSRYALNDTALQLADASFRRTTDITGAGMEQVGSWLAQQSANKLNQDANE